jgi:hypothetical protein
MLLALLQLVLEQIDGFCRLNVSDPKFSVLFLWQFHFSGGSKEVNLNKKTNKITKK